MILSHNILIQYNLFLNILIMNDLSKFCVKFNNITSSPPKSNYNGLNELTIGIYPHEVRYNQEWAKWV